MTVIDGTGVSATGGAVVAGAGNWVRKYTVLIIGCDVVCAAAAGALGFLVRFGGREGPVGANLAVALALPLLWLPWLRFSGAYDGRLYGVGSDEYRRVVHAGVGLTAAVAIASYATKAEVARGFVVVALPALTVFGVLARWRVRKWLHRRRAHGSWMRRVVAVGHPAGVSALVAELNRSPYHGMQVVAACTPGRAALTGRAGLPGGVPVRGDLDEVIQTVGEEGADSVAVLACPELDGHALRRLAWALEKDRTEIFVAPALLEVAGARTTIRPIAGLPLIHVDHPDLDGPRRLFKRAFDLAGAAGALALLAPLLLLIAALVKIGDRGRIFYAQTRIGRDGREFRMLKFRTMIPDAHRHRAEMAPTNGVMFKLRNDWRITAVGGVLRRYSLDELPQLVNVLRGDMSLVGPRPPLPEEVAVYGRDVRRRLVVKPGITGLWQVSGRSDLPWDEAVRLDLLYVENWSLMMDLQILWKTAGAVLRGSGAY
ncbi:Undecaprenyl-phosphate galactose phosphotransferase WbaP/exopolysaccharide biosynthesis polyprenyl glycosylphosphotransferase [Actinocorallia herbida]|uniref:Undecaprenyl-phosphate galactose phosphotransferase WbaP/exopolysaccharide biosynthesis polyprenyl glycosylphosphotransferase n=1 Tax=Actinocorallia herbida TaxID=58109 RepID=A0A3N1CN57_9ACTN|nr:sugar transferase [Actinocorallia herbida]ROO82749.1 Undecaprenyl-phosphate galactose phosphotransferase WbaP/exopolysaccharide biosynthesis polyprenyl glycosylphosphotransferase [Actinocorallia herbida]